MIGIIIQYGQQDFDLIRIGRHTCEECDSFVVILLGIGLLLDFK